MFRREASSRSDGRFVHDFLFLLFDLQVFWDRGNNDVLLLDDRTNGETSSSGRSWQKRAFTIPHLPYVQSREAFGLSSQLVITDSSRLKQSCCRG